MAIAPRLMQSPASRQFILGQNLQKQSLDTSPILSNTQGFARLAQALAGGLVQRDAQQKFEEEQAAKGALNAKTLASLGVDPATAALLADPKANPAFAPAAVAQAMKPKPAEKPVVVAKGAAAINPDGTVLFKNNAGQDEAINLQDLGIKVPPQFVGLFDRLAKGGDAKDVISELRAVVNDQYSIANTLRDDFESQNKTYFQYESSLDKVLSARNDGPGDLSLIFAYMKMLDPGSVVREGEFANAEKAGGVSEQVRTLYNKVVDGERLSPDQRARFRNQALDIFKPEREKYLASRERFQTLSQNAELNANLVLRPDVNPERFNVPELVDF